MSLKNRNIMPKYTRIFARKNMHSWTRNRKMEIGSVLISMVVHNKKVRYHISEDTLATKIQVDMPADTKVLVTIKPLFTEG